MSCGRLTAWSLVSDAEPTGVAGVIPVRRPAFARQPHSSPISRSPQRRAGFPAKILACATGLVVRDVQQGRWHPGRFYACRSRSSGAASSRTLAIQEGRRRPHAFQPLSAARSVTHARSAGTATADLYVGNFLADSMEAHRSRIDPCNGLVLSLACRPNPFGGQGHPRHLRTACRDPAARLADPGLPPS